MLPSLLLPLLTGAAPFQRVLSQLRDNKNQGNLAIPRAARLAVLAAIHHTLDAPLLLITDRADHALALHAELAHWLPAAPRLHFPEPAPLFYENAPWSETTRRERLQTLRALAALHIPGAAEPPAPRPELSRAEERRQIWETIRGGTGSDAPVIIASLRALMTRTLPRRLFLKHTRTIKTGQRAQPAALAADWVALGYENASLVVQPGQFATRGGILDVWTPAEPQPVRVDFFGDEIETLRPFDPASQRASGSLQRLLITPAREFIAPAEDRAGKTEQPGLPSPVPGQALSEFHLPLLHSPASLLDYLPDKALILLDDLDAIEGMAAEIEEQALEVRGAKTLEGVLPADFPVPYIPWSELYDALTLKRRLQLGPAADLQKSDLARLFTPNPRFGGRLAALLNHLKQQRNRGDQGIVVSRQASRLAELWGAEAPGTQEPAPVFATGSLEEGFIFSPPGQLRVHVLSDGEIFGWRAPQARRRPQLAGDAPEVAYADLQAGDWVVHIDHGIGRFMGLVRRTMDGMAREFLEVEYDDSDQLFVPVHQADRLTRYVGPDGRAPTPTKLGTTAWKASREKVKEAVAHVADDLLDLYARRQSAAGFAFAPDGDWQRELEAAFPYTETDDQLRALEEVKADMERARPMDRLICGDVGYGKTEVALRAAFKAVYNGKQVAVLVPTTVLAQQHYHTFRDRLAPYPVKVEMLSRFRSEAEQREILFQLALGEVDIIIGTHRLISGDVEFHDLGLLIIDEEQRFGVTHKEKLKQMRTEVDVLTLTATPIPRTMYMALTGVRDISTINTPPEERLPIITHVGPYSQQQVRQAILREMERGGQVFFVHNRVQTIYGMRTHLENLVPEAKIGVAHGQMPEKELSSRMDEFALGDLDVLLSTSIIESGLDIPNANTLIVDRADTFGLAQLYQLRGRVGRAASQAYAYFFKHRKKLPTEEGRARLETLAENTQLGAGFNIAMRDLEIRGAGDLLGVRQSGHIAAVGFHLYTRLLAEAVRAKRGAQPGTPLPLAELAALYAARPAVNVDLPIPAGIPEAYIADRETRLQLYRRLADLRETREVDELGAEFTDRFGAPPEEVVDLFFQIRVKLLAERAGIQSITPENAQLVLRFPPEAADQAFPYLGEGVRVSRNAIRMGLKGNEGWRSQLVEVLERLASNS
jgi:transcription-repair coupling factor (superfamily II helicase)